MKKVFIRIEEIKRDKTEDIDTNGGSDRVLSLLTRKLPDDCIFEIKRRSMEAKNGEFVELTTIETTDIKKDMVEDLMNFAEESDKKLGKRARKLVKTKQQRMNWLLDIEGNFVRVKQKN